MSKTFNQVNDAINDFIIGKPIRGTFDGLMNRQLIGDSIHGEEVHRQILKGGDYGSHGSIFDLGLKYMSGETFSNDLQFSSYLFDPVSTNYYDYTYYSQVYGNAEDNEIFGSTSTEVRMHTVKRVTATLNVDFTTSNPNLPSDRRHLEYSEYLFGRRGNDTIWGRDGHDYIEGGEGNDVLSGGAGHDFLDGGSGDDVFFINTPTEGSPGDYVIGGEGADTFIIGDTDSTSTEIAGGAFDWQSLAWSLAGDVSDFIFTAALPGFKDSPIELGVKLTKEVVPGVIDTVRALIDNDWSSDANTIVETPENLEAGEYIQIADFDFTEDVMVVPINGDTSNVGYQINNGNLELKYHNTGSTFAIVSLDNLNTIFNTTYSNTSNDTNVEDLIWQSVVSNAITMDPSVEDSVQIGLSQWEDNTYIDESRQLDGIDDANGMNMSYLVIGAYGTSSILGTATSSTSLYGTDGEDVLIAYSPGGPGSTGDPNDSYDTDSLYGFDGDDVLDGGGGADYYYGGNGSDTVSYSEAMRGVVVDLTTTKEFENPGYIDPVHGNRYSPVYDDGYGSSSADGHEDHLFSIENILGSQHDDVITGGRENNAFNGGGGNDILDGGVGDDTLTGGAGNDALIGNSGTDTANFAGAERGVVVRLGRGIVMDDGFGDQDTLSRIENIIGTDNDDDISGGGANSTLNGANNVFDGGKGNDNLRGEFGDDTLIGGEGDDFLTGGTQNDILVGGRGADFLNGNSGYDTFKFSWADLGEGDVIRNFDFGDTIVIEVLPALDMMFSSYQASVNSNTGAVSVEGTISTIGGAGISRTIVKTAFTLEGDFSGFNSNSVEFA